MKTLLLARHAKSDWGDPAIDDFDRPLNARGLRDAPAMAHRLVDEGDGVRLVVSSPALRAITTAREYATAFGLEPVERPELYAASARTILAAAAALPDEASVAMLVGHNPGMSDAVAELTGEFVELPTCAVVTCAVDIDSWAELIEGSGRLELVRAPRG